MKCVSYIAIVGALLVGIIGAGPGSPQQAAPASPDPCSGTSRLLATLDRPTIGYSPCAVAPGTVVFEEGYQNQRQGADFAAGLVQYPQSFTRIGIEQGLEFDVIGPYYNLQSAPNGAGGSVFTRGYQDPGLGLKYELKPFARYIVAFDGLYTAPMGSQGYSAGAPTYVFNADIGYSITPTWGVGTTIAFENLAGVDALGRQKRYGAFMPSVATTKQLNAATQLYAEYVYLNKLGPDQSGRGTVDYGIQRLFGTHVELDAELGSSITADRNLRFHYVGVGFGWQIR